MRANYSKTAQSMAVIRAIEYVRQEPADRILSDPWAVHFIPSRLWRAIASRKLPADLASAVIDRWIPGAQEYALCRARLVDDLTRELAADRLEQLVLLGAGFDTTLFRLHDCLNSVEVFEVDHPATQLVKAGTLTRMPAPYQARFVSVDFETEDFGERLRLGGFQPARRTLLTWLGVSYYLTPQAVMTTFEKAAALLAPGSRLILDHVPEGTITGTARSRAARNGVHEAARLGEPFLYGLDPARVADTVARFGFRVLAQYDPATLRARYCRRGRVPVDFMHVAYLERC
jgi:methyltransferase (TIGR00027 family)